MSRHTQELCALWGKEMADRVTQSLPVAEPPWVLANRYDRMLGLLALLAAAFNIGLLLGWCLGA